MSGEWWTFFAGLLFGAGFGWAWGAKTLRADPSKPRECDHFWCETIVKDAIIWSCSKCATSKVELFSQLTAAAKNQAAPKQGGI